MGDFVVYLRMFQAWERSGKDREFCKQHRLNVRRLSLPSDRPARCDRARPTTASDPIQRAG